jgi:hypothetical protein
MRRMILAILFIEGSLDDAMRIFRVRCSCL